MASLKILVALAIFAIAFPSTLATEWVVGGSRGWTLKFNYNLWAAGKTFVVGDTLGMFPLYLVLFWLEKNFFTGQPVNKAYGAQLRASNYSLK